MLPEACCDDRSDHQGEGTAGTDPEEEIDFANSVYCVNTLDRLEGELGSVPSPDSIVLHDRNTLAEPASLSRTEISED